MWKGQLPFISKRLKATPLMKIELNTFASCEEEKVEIIRRNRQCQKMVNKGCLRLWICDICENINF